MSADVALFAKSALLEFMRGPWGFAVFLTGSALFIFVSFKLMKHFDDKKSYAETFHPPR